MIPVMVLVQQGQIDDDAKSAMLCDLEAFSESHFGEPASVDWMVIPKGAGFTGAEQSTSVIVSLQANRELNESERRPLIEALYRLSRDHTHRTPHEVVVAIRNPRVLGAA